jgi:release factor glutamine methyltransferase
MYPLPPSAAPTLGALLERTRGRLRAAPGMTPAAAQLTAEVLLAHVLRRPRSYLIAHAQQSTSAAELGGYEALVGRALAGEPLAYLTGEREFWSLPLQVCPAVLIPRPETELAVQRCLTLLAEPPAPSGPGPGLTPRYRVCDLGTGSGAIACALAHERPAWHIVATDRSAAALHVARANAARLGLFHIEFLEGDWCAPLAGRRFDLLVSNPPYVAAGDPAMRLLGYEPPVALTPGPDGSAALRHIIRLAPRHLLPGGHLVLEHGTDQAALIERELTATGYARVCCHRDLAGHERVTEALWPAREPPGGRP